MEYRGTWREAGPAGADRYKDLPVVSIALIAANAVVYLAGVLFPRVGVLMEEYGCFSVSYLLYGKEYYRLITAVFLHVGAEHLLNNMLLLYCCGDIVEKSLGRIRFLLLYLFAGLGGNLLSAAYELFTGNFYHSVGASGAVFGLTGAMLFLVIMKKGAAAHISLRRALLSVLLSVYAGFTAQNVNNAAHVGGLLSGFILAFLLGLTVPQTPVGRRDRG